MSKQLSLFRGIILSAVWFAWLLGGYVYAVGRGPIGVVVQELSRSQPMLRIGWAIISTALLYFSIVFVLRGLGKRDTRPSA